MDFLLNHLFLDPIAMLEFVAALCTLFYMARLAFEPTIDEDLAPCRTKRTSPRKFPPAEWQRYLLQFFSVGTLISLPKRSLMSQRFYRF